VTAQLALERQALRGPQNLQHHLARVHRVCTQAVNQACHLRHTRPCPLNGSTAAQQPRAGCLYLWLQQLLIRCDTISPFVDHSTWCQDFIASLAALRCSPSRLQQLLPRIRVPGMPLHYSLNCPPRQHPQAARHVFRLRSPGAHRTPTCTAPVLSA